MMRMKRFEKAKKLLAFMMALAVGVTFIPLLGDGAYAAESEKEEVTDMPDVDLGEISGEEMEALMAEDEDAGADIPQAEDPQELLGVEDLKEALNAEPPAMEMLDPSTLEGVDLSAMMEVMNAEEPKDSTETGDITEPESAMEPENMELSAEAADDSDQMEMCDAKGMITVKDNISKKTATISGTLPAGETFSKFYINGTLLLGPGDQGMGGSTLNVTLQMDAVPVGLYIVTVETSKGNIYMEPVISYVYRVPANKISQYEVYHNRFVYSVTKTPYIYGSSSYDSDCKVYMDYKIKGKKWPKKPSKGPMETYTDYNIKKLKSGQKYQARAYYGKVITFQGKNYLISGADSKKFSKTATFKTGPKALKFKKVTVKLTNVKRHSYKKYGSLGVYHGKVVYYTCKIKATVKLKKKPGAAGIYINNKKVKGNKKTYTANLGKATTSLYFGKYKAKTYNWYKSDEYFNLPKGKKYKLLIYSYNSKEYGGYSKAYTKKVKMR